MVPRYTEPRRKLALLLSAKGQQRPDPRHQLHLVYSHRDMVQLSGNKRRGFPASNVARSRESRGFRPRLTTAERREILGCKPDWQVMAGSYAARIKLHLAQHQERYKHRQDAGNR